MKKIIPILLIMALIVLSLPVVALADPSCGDSCTYNIDSEGKLVITGSGKIKDRAFDLNNQIKTVEIGEGITEIGEWAFANDSYSEVKIPASVKKIGKGAFAYTYSLKKVTIAENSVLETIEADAFCGADFPEITIPASVKTIGSGAFCGFEKPLNVTFLGCPTSIHAEAFAYSTVRVTIAEGVKWTYGATAFGDTFYCPTVSSVNGVKYCIYGDGYVVITKDSDNHSDTAVIEARKFASNPNVNEIVIGEGITGIGNEAFIGTKIRTIVFPASVKTVGSEIFKSCSRLTKVTFLGNPTSIDSHAFQSGPDLSVILADPDHWTHGTSMFSGRATYYKADGKSHYSGSVLSEGNIWIIVGVAAVVLVAVAALVIAKKKKKPALAGENKDEE